MDLFTGALIAVIVILLLYYLLWHPLTYFKDLGVPHERAIPILGNMAPIIFQRISMAEELQRVYNRYPDARYFGFYNFGMPVIVLRDPELLNAIGVKNFDQFCDRRGFVDEDRDPMMGGNLFSLHGDRWRDMRRVLSPAFTASKMKTMFTLMCDCTVNFADYIAMESKGGKVYEVKNIFRRCTTDILATCCYGLSVDSMRNPNNDFYMFGERSLNFLSSLSIKFLMGKNFATLFKLLGVRFFNDEAHKYFLRVITEMVRMREEKGIHRPDMIQLMMETRDKDGGGGLSIEEMTNQAFVFFFGGVQTTTNILCFAAHEIAVNPEVKAKLRAEIEEVGRKTNGNPTYEDIRDMQYMDAVLHESLRLYSLGFMDRICVKEFQLPPATPDSKPVTIKPGRVVWFLPYSLQRDSAHFPDPMKFRPERFLNGEVSQSTYVPFGVGPRICLGKRFALMESKLLMFHLLWRCDVEPCADTSIPMKLNKKSFVLAAENGFWLKFRTT